MARKKTELPIWHPGNPEGPSRMGQLEKRLKIPKGFCAALWKEDDWSFLIKIYALLEAALTQAIIRKVGSRAIASFIARRGISEKLRLAQGLKLLTKDHTEFVDQLVELRNPLVHTVRQLNFSLKTFLTKSKKAKRQSIRGRLLRIFATDDRQDKGVQRMITRDPKFVIWTGTLYLVDRLVAHIELVEIEKDSQNANRKFDRLQIKSSKKLLRIIEDMSWDESTRADVGEMVFSVMQQLGKRGRTRAKQLSMFD